MNRHGNDWKIEHKFAWRKVFIRNRLDGYLFGSFVNSEWVWLKKYTRVSYWHEGLGRYRTWDTVLGHVDYDVSGERPQRLN